MLALVRESEEGWRVEMSTNFHNIRTRSNFLKACISTTKVHLNTVSPPKNRTIADKHPNLLWTLIKVSEEYALSSWRSGRRYKAPNILDFLPQSFVDSSSRERAGVTNQDMVIRSD